MLKISWPPKKIVNINIPSKVKDYIEGNLAKEIGHFKSKYKLDFNLISDEKLNIPEYKIDLLNKNKKIIKKVENLEKVEKISLKHDYVRKGYTKNKNFKNNKFKKKFKYYSKTKKNNFSNKKIANY